MILAKLSCYKRETDPPPFRTKTLSSKNEKADSRSFTPNPFPLQYTQLQEDRFLIYDNESTTERILVFTSEMGIQQLGAADIWFMIVTHLTGLFVLSF
jgi:hypothetical protein